MKEDDAPPDGPAIDAAIDPATMQARAEEAADFLRSMASPHRLMILCNLLKGEQTVGALADRLGVGQTLASQHLARLRAEGLVATRREGTSIHYRLASPLAAEFVGTMYRLFCAPGSAPEAARTAMTLEEDRA